MIRQLRQWMLVGALGLVAVERAPAQWLHKQQPCCPSCAPVIVAPATPGAPATPAPTGPMGEPIPAPMGEQPPPMPMSSDFTGDLGGEALSTFDSSVGYIDSAIPANIFRLRADMAYDINRGSRAEFFYAAGQPLGPGQPLPDLSEDYQEFMAYLEYATSCRCSVFIETPVRLNNPEINANHAGFGDMNFGFKYAFQFCPEAVSSFQLRMWLPTGDPDMGLGNDHVTIEPGLLVYRQLSDKLRMEGELRFWWPVDGTDDFAGEIIRYGIGFSYGERPADDLWLTPVVEVVGWTVLDGLQRETPPLTPAVIADASGDTIVNLKLGVRLGMGDIADIYTGYGRALTGDVWYQDVWRTELRIAY